MPGATNGIEVTRLMRAQHPIIPIIYTTGRPDMLSAIEPLGPQEALVVKPYTPAKNTDVVHRLLGQNRGGLRPTRRHPIIELPQILR